MATLHSNLRANFRRTVQTAKPLRSNVYEMRLMPRSVALDATDAYCETRLHISVSLFRVREGRSTLTTEPSVGSARASTSF